MGFFAIDLAETLDLPLFDPSDKDARVADNTHPKAGNGVLGQDPAKPDLVVATYGGPDLSYLPNRDKKLADRTIKALLEQDYVSGLFVDDKLGRAAAAGGLTGRVMSEALPNGIIPKAADGSIVSKPAANGLQTVVKFQRVLSQRYFDAAGFPGRTVGIDPGSGKQ
jgi:hypothetical protein